MLLCLLFLEGKIRNFSFEIEFKKNVNNWKINWKLGLEKKWRAVLWEIKLPFNVCEWLNCGNSLRNSIARDFWMNNNWGRVVFLKWNRQTL